MAAQIKLLSDYNRRYNCAALFLLIHRITLHSIRTQVTSLLILSLSLHSFGTEQVINAWQFALTVPRARINRMLWETRQINKSHALNSTAVIA